MEDKEKVKELLEQMRKEELERIRRFKKYLEEQASWVVNEKDASLLLEVVENFLEEKQK